MADLARRTLFHAGSAAAAAAVIGGSAPRPAHAEAAKQDKQAPGFYRMKLGEFEITVISDGTLTLPPGLWIAPQGEVVAALAAEFRPTDIVTLQLNTILVNTGAKLVLIDAGTGGKFQGTSGAVQANLAAAGYHPEQVDTVVFTHAHPDHLWGVTDASNGKLLFPNAEYVGSEAEIAFWSADALSGQVPEGMKAMVDATQVNLKAIGSRMRRVNAGAEILPGIDSVSTPGHTPGHMSIHLGSGSDTLLVSGDVVANDVISFRYPAWGIGFDLDPALAAKTRAAFLDRCVADKTMVASYHLPFPAVGHVVREGSAYRWVPAEWRWTA